MRTHSSPGVTRALCGRCGTPLTYEGDRWPGEVHMLTGSIDRPEDLVPARDAFAEDEPPWVPMALARQVSAADGRTTAGWLQRA